MLGRIANVGFGYTFNDSATPRPASGGAGSGVRAWYSRYDLSCCRSMSSVTTPSVIVAGPRSVSTCVTCTAWAIALCGMVSANDRGPSARFQTRAITPWSMPSSAGLSVHTRTSGDGSETKEQVSGGSDVSPLPVSAASTSGFWCSSAKRIAAAGS